MTTVATVIALAIAAGFAPPQAEAISHFAYTATHLGTHYSFDAELDECASSWRGEGLVDATGGLRKRLHADTGYAGCVPAAVQIEWLARTWPALCPHSANLFNAGKLDEFRSAWGRGVGCR